MVAITGEMVHAGGSATTASKRIQVQTRRGTTAIAKCMVIECTDAANDLLVSFDDGAHTIKVLHGAPAIQFLGIFSSFAVASSASTATWSAVLTVG